MMKTNSENPMSANRYVSKVRSVQFLPAVAGLALLVALHLDFWREQRPVLYFGWLPEEMAWRLLWIFAAWLYLLYFTTRVWREEP